MNPVIRLRNILKIPLLGAVVALLVTPALLESHTLSLGLGIEQIRFKSELPDVMHQDLLFQPTHRQAILIDSEQHSLVKVFPGLTSGRRGSDALPIRMQIGYDWAYRDDINLAVDFQRRYFKTRPASRPAVYSDGANLHFGSQEMSSFSNLDDELTFRIGYEIMSDFLYAGPRFGLRSQRLQSIGNPIANMVGISDGATGLRGVEYNHYRSTSSGLFLGFDLRMELFYDFALFVGYSNYPRLSGRTTLSSVDSQLLGGTTGQSDSIVAIYDFYDKEYRNYLSGRENEFGLEYRLESWTLQLGYRVQSFNVDFSGSPEIYALTTSLTPGRGVGGHIFVPAPDYVGDLLTWSQQSYQRSEEGLFFNILFRIDFSGSNGDSQPEVIRMQKI